MKVLTTETTVPANEILGTAEKKLSYLIIENSLGQRLTINVGEKTIKLVNELNAAEEKALENVSEKTLEQNIILKEAVREAQGNKK